MPKTRLGEIRLRLREAFAPTLLEVVDESDQHAGHAGARGGGGHFALMITAPAFDGKSRLQQHRMIYEALGKLMEKEIHALRIKVV